MTKAGQVRMMTLSGSRSADSESSLVAGGSASDAKYSCNASTRSAFASAMVAAAVITPGSSSMRPCTQPFSTVSKTAVQVSVEVTSATVVATDWPRVWT